MDIYIVLYRFYNQFTLTLMRIRVYVVDLTLSNEHTYLLTIIFSVLATRCVCSSIPPITIDGFSLYKTIDEIKRKVGTSLFVKKSDDESCPRGVRKTYLTTRSLSVLNLVATLT